MAARLDRLGTMPEFAYPDATPLVGRKRELEFLEQALHATRSGAGRCVLLTGEAGIGKSRLVAEVRARAADEHCIIWQGHCFEQDASFPYGPWIDALRTYLAPKSPAELGQVLGSFAPELVKLLPELSLIDPALEPRPRLDPEAEKHRLFESLARFAASCAAAHPLLIILEDVHWSDEQSLDLLRFFVHRIAALPILLIATSRSEDLTARVSAQLAQLSRVRLVTEMRLAALERDEVLQMVRALRTFPRPLTGELLDDLMRLTEGNPFFVVEILHALPDTGGFDAWQIPRSIRDAVQQRVERLPERTRRFLALAAVIGERFDVALAHEVAGHDEQSLLAMLKELIAAQLIVEQSADQFAFSHALAREAVYATLLRRERRALHQAVAETLERLAGMRAGAEVAQLAYHYYQAGVWDKAMQYAQRAGEQALALYAMHEAVTDFSHALDSAQHLGIPAPLSSLRSRGRAREVMGDFDGARVDYSAALAAAGAAADPAAQCQALVDLGLLWQSRDLEQAGDYFQQALETARDLGDSSILAQTLNRVGNWHANCGRARQGLPYHREALALFRSINDRRGMAQTMDLLGIASYQLGEVIQGAAYLEQAIPVLRELDDRQGLVNTLMNLSFRAFLDTEVLGETTYAQLAFPSEEAQQIARGFHWYHGEARALIRGATALAQAGDYARALAWLGRARLLGEGVGAREPLARLHITLGDVYTWLLALTDAQQHLEAALALAHELGSGLLVVSSTARLAATLILQGNLARARDLLAAPAAAGIPEGALTAPLRGFWGVCAELQLAEGDATGALDITDRLLASTANLTQYGPYAVPYLSRLRGRILAALGRTDEAEANLRGALAVAQAHGQPPMLWRLQADLGRVYRTMGRRADAQSAFASARTIIEELAGHIDDGALRENFVRQALIGIPSAPVLTARQAAKRELSGLTAREREIAALIAQGKSNRDIADALVISPKTAERHVANILSKLGFNARTQIAAWAAEKQLNK